MTADLPTIDALLREHGLGDVAEEPFPNDGWSGASMTLLRRRDGERFVLKRDSPDRDWIARATRDGPVLREAWFAAAGPALPGPIRNPALGAAFDPATGDSAVLMPDLGGVLFDWNAVLAIEQLDLVLAALASLHGAPAPSAGPWCPIPERVALISRASLERPGAARDAVAERLLPGWDLFDRLASPTARDVVAALSDDVTPLVRALEASPGALIHADLKLANVGIAADGAVEVVDWQMVTVAPVSIELGWFLVSNVNALPLSPDQVLGRYWRLRAEDPGRENDLAILVGLLLRGWRKGYDAEAR
ncbi:MAG TPA: aminoglycoside phosphotransferase family protein, partial [Candidatus Limnocylindrales bacterium]|nr:aminoglycoside phosphotransferase family protein [Candidatus Limnocylindrales bacterium]